VIERSDEDTFRRLRADDVVEWGEFDRPAFLRGNREREPMFVPYRREPAAPWPKLRAGELFGPATMIVCLAGCVLYYLFAVLP
jgi:hypothetical protein